MLLGFIVFECGIEANPEKISAITRMGPIQNIKGIERVTGCLAVLSSFISCLGERGLYLYRLMKKANHFEWRPEAQEALDTIKQLLTKAPIQVPLTDGELLLLYIMATTQVVSAALVVEREEEGHASKCSIPCTSLARSCLILRLATPKSKNSYMPSSSPRGSYVTTSSRIR